MKNIKKIMVFTTLGLLVIASNAPAMHHWRTLCKPFAAFTTLSYTTAYHAINYLGVDTPKAAPFILTQKQRQSLEERFNRYRDCTDLTVVQLPSELEATVGAMVDVKGSECLLYLPTSFFQHYPYVQESILAHESVHFSENHQQKELIIQTLSIGCISTLFYKVKVAQIHSLRSLTLLSLFELGTTLTSLVIGRIIITKKQEKEADLKDKTCEEIIGLLTGDMDSYSVANEKIAELLCLEDRTLFCTEKTPLLEQFNDPHPPKEQRLVYLANQFEKQVNNPTFDDFPRSKEECKKALGTYFKKENDYKTGTPTIDHPLIHKRVALLREQLRWHQSNEA